MFNLKLCLKFILIVLLSHSQLIEILFFFLSCILTLPILWGLSRTQGDENYLLTFLLKRFFIYYNLIKLKINLSYELGNRKNFKNIFSHEKTALRKKRRCIGVSSEEKLMINK